MLGEAFSQGWLWAGSWQLLAGGLPTIPKEWARVGHCAPAVGVTPNTCFPSGKCYAGGVCVTSPAESGETARHTLRHSSLLGH